VVLTTFAFLDALAVGGAEAKRAFDAMMGRRSTSLRSRRRGAGRCGTQPRSELTRYHLSKKRAHLNIEKPSCGGPITWGRRSRTIGEILLRLPIAASGYYPTQIRRLAVSSSIGR
jgi:hypothetical protein